MEFEPNHSLVSATSRDTLDEAEHAPLPVEQLLASDTPQDTLNKAKRTPLPAEGNVDQLLTSATSQDTLYRARNTPLPAEQNVDQILASSTSQDTLYGAKHTPLPVGQGESLLEPRPPFLSADSPSPQDSYVQSTPNESALLVADKESQPENFTTPPSSPSPKPKRRTVLLPLIVSAVLVVLAIAVIVPVYFVVIKPKNNRTSQHSNPPQPTGSNPSPTKSPNPAGATWGGDGSTVKATNGSTFTYHNKLGGIWYSDPDNPYSNNAYPNSWTPPLNKSWNYGTDRIYGVNLGGWFVLEPFITPALFQRYPSAIDEWTLSTLMAADTANGGLTQLENHYKTFITEDDIAEIAGAGLNWVRLPVPFWAIDVWGNEPFLSKISWKYIIQAIQWCRKYGIRVNLDLHSAPGSQSGFNHSGKEGQANLLVGAMGYANAQRTLNYIRIYTEFFSQSHWKNVVPMFSILNEPRTIPDEQLRAFYYEAYQVIRQITGIGEGNGPFIVFSDGFSGVAQWAGFMTGADRIAIDTHPYFAFSAAADPIDTGTGSGAGGVWPASACSNWASGFNTSRTAFGVTMAGEWSVALNDCGMFLRGSTSVPTGDCTPWSDSSKWSAGTKAGLMQLALATMDSFRDWFYWTWKIGPSQNGIIESAVWSYQSGLRGGWIPTDPRIAIGACGASTGPVFSGSFEPWMTGGAGAGQIQTQYAWPPASAAGSFSYTAAGPISTLPEPTFTNLAGKPISSGSGWFNPNDNAPAPTPIPGCTYPNAWDAQAAGAAGGCVQVRDVDPVIDVTPTRTTDGRY